MKQTLYLVREFGVLYEKSFDEFKKLFYSRGVILSRSIPKCKRVWHWVQKCDKGSGPKKQFRTTK